MVMGIVCRIAHKGDKISKERNSGKNANAAIF
jgi:hypothetical protein